MARTICARTFRRLFSAALVLGALTSGAHIAGAADLYSDDPPPPRYGSAYDDPRYADLYGRAPPRPRIETYRPYDDAAPLPRERVLRDDDRYSERPPPQRSARGCPSKDEISRGLERDGWGGFRNPQVLDRNTATIDAVRPNGRPYRLEVDRCTGEILASRPLDQPRARADADRYSPPYYPDDARRPLRSY